MTERERAFLVLQRVELFDSHLPALLSREGSFVREVVRGVLRWRLRLDYIVSHLSSRPLNKIDQRALQILRTALYQLMFMDTPAYAVVNDAVALTARHASRARGFVNAVLRKGCSTNLRDLLPRRDDPGRAAVELAHPLWLLEKWTRFFGQERALAIGAANQKHSHADLLVNSRAIPLEKAEEILRTRGVAWTHSPLVPQMVRLQGPTAPLKPEIELGIFHPMDDGSALVASLVGGTNQHVLDLAAAPGGKSLLMRLHGHQVVSHDRSIARLWLLQRSLSRLIGSSASLVAGDGTRAPFRKKFDAVLLDAPCSGTGTIRKNPEIKWRLDRQCFGRFARFQRGLLSGALELAGNECIYSTCSLEPEENDEVVEAVLRSRPEFSIADLTSRLPESAQKWVEGGILRLTPDSGADGFTAFALIRRRSDG